MDISFTVTTRESFCSKVCLIYQKGKEKSQREEERSLYSWDWDSPKAGAEKFIVGIPVWVAGTQLLALHISRRLKLGTVLELEFRHQPRQDLLLDDFKHTLYLCPTHFVIALWLHAKAHTALQGAKALLLFLFVSILINRICTLFGTLSSVGRFYGFYMEKVIGL